MEINPAAKNYAIALAEVAQDRLLDIEEQLKTVDAVFAELPLLRQFYESPKIRKEAKSKVLQDAFSGFADKLVLNLLSLLVDNSRADLLHDVIIIFIQDNDKRLNRVSAEVYLPRKLPEDQLSEIIARVKSLIQENPDIFQLPKPKEVHVITRVNEALLGGLILKIDDYVLDASVSAYLKKWKREIKSKKLKGLEKAWQE